MTQPPTICLVTPTQPTLNPRLVKEADALAEAGYDVQVVCCYYQAWAVEADRALLASKAWSCAYVGGSPETQSAKYWWTRIRNGVARRLVPLLGTPRWLEGYAMARCYVELERQACATPADLYIAHNVEALPAVAAAGEKHGKPFGFDAEDFHSGMGLIPPYDLFVDHIESAYLPRCAYVTAGSPGIAEAYAERRGMRPPVPVLNVFPLALRGDLHGVPHRSEGPLTLYWFSQTIGPGRGLEEVVEAMGAIRDCQIELHLQGQWQPGFQEQLLNLARRGQVESRIHSHPPAHSDRLVELSAGYDVGLALEITVPENRGICLTNKLFIYLLAGNAILATATPAQARILASWGPAGYLYNPGDIAALARGLRRWHDDRGLLRAARERAWHLGTTRYNWDVEKRLFLETVGNVLPLSRRPPSCTVA